MGRYPGLVFQPKGIEAQTLSLDFAASILEVCEAPPLPKTQGRSWKSLVTVGDPDGEDRMPMDEGIKGELPDEKIR